MTEFRIKITCDNAAFDGKPSEEIARILRRLADSIEDTGVPGDEGLNPDAVAPAGEWPRTIRDLNGNKVGIASWKGNDD